MLLDVIKNIVKANETAGEGLTYALVIADLIPIVKDRERLERELNELAAKRFIEIGNTINDRYVRVL